MSIPTNGITAEVFREAMPPYQLSADLLAAMFTAIPAPPPDSSVAWRLTRAAQLVREVSGLMPANAPQARIAAGIVIYNEAAEDAVARSGAPGVTVEQVCRLRRTAAALTVSTAVLERSLVRHKQKPVPFFGTVLADRIDIAALAVGWGGPGLRWDGGEIWGGGASADGPVPLAETMPGSSAWWQALAGSSGAGPTGYDRRSRRGDGTGSSHDGGLRSGRRRGGAGRRRWVDGWAGAAGGGRIDPRVSGVDPRGRRPMRPAGW
jgi:hypothetical protein